MTRWLLLLRKVDFARNESSRIAKFEATIMDDGHDYCNGASGNALFLPLHQSRCFRHSTGFPLTVRSVSKRSTFSNPFSPFLPFVSPMFFCAFKHFAPWDGNERIEEIFPTIFMPTFSHFFRCFTPVAQPRRTMRQAYEKLSLPRGDPRASTKRISISLHVCIINLPLRYHARYREMHSLCVAKGKVISLGSWIYIYFSHRESWI